MTRARAGKIAQAPDAIIRLQPTAVFGGLENVIGRGRHVVLADDELAVARYAGRPATYGVTVSFKY